MREPADLVIGFGLATYFLIGMGGCWLFRRRDISLAKWFWGGSSGWVLAPREYFVPEHKNWARGTVLGFLPTMIALFGLADLIGRLSG